jgi:hypothetical protein
MGAFTSATQLSPSAGVPKVGTFSAVGPASYDTGGSVIDLSVATLGAGIGFVRVDNVMVTSSSSAHSFNYVRAASGAAATGKIVVKSDALADGGDEVAGSTSLSGVTFYLTVSGV